MLTPDENDFFAKVGPGTPAGEFLRRYWHPIAPVRELSDERPTRFVRILGEDLVLFKDTSGRVGLLADHCSHRGASLLYGRVEERGIACASHDWLYDTRGNCLETPAEPRDSRFFLTIKHPAYPVQEYAGMYWAYLGPAPAPVIPGLDMWARQDGRRWIEILPQLDCDWFQYRLPLIGDVPERFFTTLIENGDGPGPFGSKGVSQTSIPCVAPAIGNAIAAATERWVVVVDDDIDPTNLKEVLWAMTTRCDPARDIEIVDGCWSTPLDPLVSADPEKRDSEDHTNSVAIFYANRPFHLKGSFPKVSRAPRELREQVVEKYRSILPFPAL